MGSDMFDMLMIFRLACLPLSTLTALHERLLTVPQAASQGRNCPQCSHPDVTATPTPNRKPCSVIGPFLSARHVHRASLRSIMTIRHDGRKWLCQADYPRKRGDKAEAGGITTAHSCYVAGQNLLHT